MKFYFHFHKCSAGPKGGALGVCAPPPPEEAVSALKTERQGGRGGTDMAVSVTQACK